MKSPIRNAYKAYLLLFLFQGELGVRGFEGRGELLGGIILSGVAGAPSFLPSGQLPGRTFPCLDYNVMLDNSFI